MLLLGCDSVEQEAIYCVIVEITILGSGPLGQNRK